MIDYEDNNECLKKQKQIIDELTSSLNYNEKFEEIFKHPGDTSGKSTVYGIYLIFDYGNEVEVTCYDFSQKIQYSSGLDVAVNSKEYIDWLSSL